MFSCNAAAVVGMVWLAGSAAAQSVPLPAAPAGVETFRSNGIEFSRVRAANVTPYLANGNGNYHAPIGGGSWDFAMARTELTHGQWVEFLNAFDNVAVPAGQPWSQGLNELFEQTGSAVGAYFTEAGPLGRPRWQVTPVGALIPTSNLGWYGGALYSNWLHNGREASISALNTGAYDLRGWNNSDPSTWPSVTRSPDARFFIPTYDEWAVASFFDERRFGEGQPGWWPYLNGRDRLPIPGAPGLGETASGWDGTGSELGALYLPIASYPNSQSPFGLFDTSGTYFEFVENNFQPGDFDRLLAGTRSGVQLFPESELRHETLGWIGADSPFSNGGGIYTTVRVAASIPCPSVSGFAFLGCFIFFGQRRRLP